MKRFCPPALALVALAFFLAGSANGQRYRESQPPYVVQGLVSSPILIMENVVSTKAHEFSIAFTQDGYTAFFNRAFGDDGKLIRLMYTRFGEAWTVPAQAPFSSDRWLDLDPVAHPDGEHIYFTSNRPLEGDSPGDFDTWYVEWREGYWGDPVHAGPVVNSDSADVYVSFTKDGDMCFSSRRDTSTARRVYISRNQGGELQPPELVPLMVEGAYPSVGNPCIAQDGSYIIFAAGGEVGEADLFIARRDRGTWRPAQNLGAGINSEFNDYAPCISPDGRYLFFTSERPGIVAEIPEGAKDPGDIYMIDVTAVLAP
jgi:Tol biopolymer transport system component